MRNKLIINYYKEENGKLNHHHQQSHNLADEMTALEVCGLVIMFRDLMPNCVELEFYHEHWERNEGDFNEIHHQKNVSMQEGKNALAEYLVKLYVK